MHPVYSHIICLMPRRCIPVILTLLVSTAMNIKYLLSRSTCAQFQKSLKKHCFICFCYPSVDVIINSHLVHDISSQIIEMLCSGNKFVSNKKTLRFFYFVVFAIQGLPLKGLFLFFIPAKYVVLLFPSSNLF